MARSMDGRIALARQIRGVFKQTKGVVDVDWYVEDDQPKYSLSVDEEKAAINGISEDDIAREMQVASAGYAAGLLHQDAEKEDIALTVRLDRACAFRSGANPEPEDRRTQRPPGRVGRTSARYKAGRR